MKINSMLENQTSFSTVHNLNLKMNENNDSFPNKSYSDVTIKREQIYIKSEDLSDTDSKYQSNVDAEIKTADIDILNTYPTEELDKQPENLIKENLIATQCDPLHDYQSHTPCFEFVSVNDTNENLKDLFFEDTNDKLCEENHNINKKVVTKLYYCNLCNYGFHNKSDLEKHKDIHLGKISHDCNICNKRFKLKGNLKAHMRTHTGKRPFKCGVCLKKFTNSNHLKVHSRIHTGEIPYVCDICNKGFTQSSNLKVHKLIHTSDKPYQCGTCNKRFNHKVGLTEHEYIHSDERPYVCDICNKGFTQASNLKVHKFVHTNEKPYGCDLCNKRFNHKYSLNEHKRIHTNKIP